VKDKALEFLKTLEIKNTQGYEEPIKEVKIVAHVDIERIVFSNYFWWDEYQDMYNINKNEILTTTGKRFKVFKTIEDAGIAAIMFFIWIIPDSMRKNFIKREHYKEYDVDSFDDFLNLLYRHPELWHDRDKKQREFKCKHPYYKDYKIVYRWPRQM